MSKVGSELKKAREAAEKTRAQVAKDTGILIHELAALEFGDWGSLPDEETVAEYVREYAEYLGFVPDAPVAEYWAERRAEVSAAAPVALPDPGGPEPAAGPSPMGPRLLGAFALLVVAVVVIGWILLFNREGDPLREVSTPGAPTDTLAGETPSADDTIDASGPAATTEDSSETDRAEPDPTAADSTEPVEAEPDMASTEPDPAATETPSPAPEAERAAADSAAETADSDTAATPPPARDTRPAPTQNGASTLSVSEHGVGTGIRDRNLIGRADRFPEGSQVYFWTRVVNGAAGDTVHHVWLHEGSEVDDIPLRIGSAHWRTQSRKTLYDGGRWAVEARDSDGRVLARTEFTGGG